MANDWNRAVVLASGRSIDVGEEPEFGGFFKSLVKVVNPVNIAKEVGKGIKTVGRVSGKLGATIGRVPVVGKGLHAVYNIGPAGLIETASRVASGERLDKAAVGHFKRELNNVREIAPYAQTVVSLVPGVGQGVAGAIGAGVALSRGQPITKALVEGVRGSLPGGPVASAAFDVAMAAAQGKSIDEVALNAIPLPADQKKYIVQAAQAAKDIAQGKNVAKAVYDRGQKLLPPDAQKAMQVAVAMASAKNLQDAMVKGASEAIPKIAGIGQTAILKDPTFKAGLETLKHNPNLQKGFKVGAGIVKHKFSPTELNAVRGRLAPEVKKGFDIALSAHVGKVSNPDVAKKKIDPKKKFGFYTQRGLRVAKPKNQKAIQSELARDPAVTQGVLGAIKVSKKEKAIRKMGFFARLKYIITGK